MVLQKIEAVVLRTTPFSETSLVGSVFARQLGRVSVIARGARRPGRAVAAAFQPMQEIACLVYMKSGSGLKTVSQVELKTAYPGIARSALLLGLAGRALELVTFQTPEEEPSARVFFLLKEILEILDDCSNEQGRVGLLAFEFRLQRAIGYGLRAIVCARCGKISKSTSLSPSAGGILCPDCRNGVSDLTTLAKEELGILQGMLTLPLKVWLKRGMTKDVTFKLGGIAGEVWEAHSPFSGKSSAMSFIAELTAEGYG